MTTTTELRLVRADGGPLDIAEDELATRRLLGVQVFFERTEADLPRAIRIEAGEGYEDVARDCAAEMAEALGLVAVDLTAGAALQEAATAPWWAFWRGR